MINFGLKLLIPVYFEILVLPNFEIFRVFLSKGKIFPFITFYHHIW